MWTAVTISPRHRLTQEAVEVAVHPRFGSLQFRNGQFVVLEVALENGIRRSAFSIVRKEGKGVILGVKQNGDHGISAWLNGLTEPTKAFIAGPFGQFQINPSATKHIFITGGSGITPVRSMFDELLAEGIKPILIYANQSPERAMYLESFRKLASLDGLELIEIYDRDITKALGQVDLQDAEVYTCGPSGLINNALESLALYKVPEDNIQTELYGLDMDAARNSTGSFVWKSMWGSAKKVPMAGHKNMLDGAIASDVNIPHACGIGVCGTCRATVIKGSVICGKESRQKGDEILTCISKPFGTEPTMVGPAKGGRSQVMAIALLIGAVFLGMWKFPPAIGFKALGPMNTSHENLECNACHTEAPGTFRQQVGHNAQALMGLHGHEMVPVGFAPVDNKACMSCHYRPNDRHPVSRFLETRYAQQREDIGPHECNNCHGEHNGKRVALVEPGFCIHCHQDMEVSFDSAQPSHAELIEDGAWETCLQCHDFHGNHIREVPHRLTEGIAPEKILQYLEGAADPYGPDKTHTAESK